jgi:hypothetical protein
VNGRPLLAAVLQFSDLLRPQVLVSTKSYPPRFGGLNAIHLALGTQLRFKLCNRPQHMEQEPTGGIRGINLLI